MYGLNGTISSHKASQLGHGGDRETGGDRHASSMNHKGGVRTGLCDRSIAVHDKSIKAHASERDKFSPLKIALIPRSHGIFNSWVMKVFFLRTL